jgi:hypothetical protein
MKIRYLGFIAAVSLAWMPAYSSYCAEEPPDASHKTVAESAKELGHAVKRDAKAVGKAVKEGAQEVGSAAKRGAKKVKAAVKKTD